MNTKKTLLAFALLTISSIASAELFTPTQTETFAGPAGSNSVDVGVDPFTFQKFDSSLGTLTGIIVNYSFSIDNGLIGADNLSNAIVYGTGELGASLSFSSSLPFIDTGFATVFTQLDLGALADFTLAADPLMTTGGNGPDVAQLTGGYHEALSGPHSISPIVFNGFIGNAGDTYDVNFNVGSITLVSVPGAQGYFQTVDSFVSLDITYQYESNTPVTSDVNLPLSAAAGLLMLGFGAVRRRDE